jgi:phosphopantetheinyl transferase
MALVDQWTCKSGTKLNLYDIHIGSQIYDEKGIKYSARELELLSVQKVIEDCYTGSILSKDEFGKPFLVPQNSEINYSHTSKRLLWGEHPTLRVGVDIETLRPQLSKIKHKFCREDELSFIPTQEELPYLLAIWSAKESIYKAYGKKEVDFKEHMQIEKFKLESEGFFEANFLLVSNFRMVINYRWTGEYMITWTTWQSMNENPFIS